VYEIKVVGFSEHEGKGTYFFTGVSTVRELEENDIN
jgi:hypothetical protein